MLDELEEWVDENQFEIYDGAKVIAYSSLKDKIEELKERDGKMNDDKDEEEEE